MAAEERQRKKGSQNILFMERNEARIDLLC
jgi:hypothetical protein